MFFRLLPWEYAIRNLFRRPLRALLTFAGLTTVILLVLVVVGFIRGLERSLNVSGEPAQWRLDRRILFQRSAQPKRA